MLSFHSSFRQAAGSTKIENSIMDPVESTAAGTSQKVKLPYFHRTLSEEEKGLIGDITPKRIEVPVSDPVASEAAGGSTPSLVQGSAWNAAKIWEERDYTPWAKETITTLFSDSMTLTQGDVTLIVTEIESVSGHANLTCSRGKPRYMYSFKFSLKFSLDIAGFSGDCAGTVEVDDVINDLLDDIELAVTWSSRPPNAHLKACNAVTSGKILKDAIAAKMLLFERDFRNVQ